MCIQEGLEHTQLPPSLKRVQKLPPQLFQTVHSRVRLPRLVSLRAAALFTTTQMGKFYDFPTLFAHRICPQALSCAPVEFQHEVSRRFVQKLWGPYADCYRRQAFVFALSFGVLEFGSFCLWVIWWWLFLFLNWLIFVLRAFVLRCKKISPCSGRSVCMVFTTVDVILTWVWVNPTVFSQAEIVEIAILL